MQRLRGAIQVNLLAANGEWLDNVEPATGKVYSRLPDSVVGDLTAEISCCNRGAAQVLELVRKYGPEIVTAAADRIS